MSAVSRDDVRARMATVLGDEQAEQAVAEAERAMKVSTSWDAAAADAVIGHLTTRGGVVGAAARLLKSRSRSSSQGLRAVSGSDIAVASAAARRTPIEGHSTVPSVPRSSGTKTVFGPNAEKLVAMLAHAVGDEKARALLLDTLQRRSVDPRTMTADEGLAALEELSQLPGAVGTVARFAKARAHFELA